MRHLTILLLVLPLVLAGCVASADSPDDLPKLVGKQVSIEGTATSTPKGGPTIMFNGAFVLVDSPANFVAYASRKVRVTGTLRAVPDPLRPSQVAYKVENARWQRLD
jgi:hypothetical protein